MRVSNIITPKAKAPPFASRTNMWVFNDMQELERTRQQERPGSDILLVPIGPNGMLTKDLSKYDLPKIFVEMHEVHSLLSLKGLPRTIQAMYGNTQKDEWGGPAHRYGPLNSLEGAPLHVIGDWDLNAPGITSLRGVGQKFLLSCKSFCIYPENEHHLLNLLRVEGLQKVKGKYAHVNDPRIQIAVILNKHLTTKDILACQEELIDAGFEEAATL